MLQTFKERKGTHINEGVCYIRGFGVNFKNWAIFNE